MKILQLSTEDNSGGASRSAYRLHQALTQIEAECTMRVLTHQAANIRVIAGKGERSFSIKLREKIKENLHDLYAKSWKSSNPVLHTFGNVSAGITNEINQFNADVVNLHWVSKLLSIRDIGKICKPIVWTLHDMWPFCGGEHYAPDGEEARFRIGYFKNNRSTDETGPDLNRSAWEAKKISWARQKFNFIAPSHWMADCVQNSALFRNSNSTVQVIANPLDVTNIWKPINKSSAKALLGLDQNKRYILAGSAGGMALNKGEDYLPRLMGQIEAVAPGQFEMLIFGRSSVQAGEKWPCKVNWLGSVREDNVMATIYSAADVMVVPSRQDNLPNTAIEANACGTPVVAFKIGGLPDIIKHQENGWLVQPFDIKDMAHGVLWMTSEVNRWSVLSANSRKLTVNRYSPQVIASKYLEAYQQAIDIH